MKKQSQTILDKAEAENSAISVYKDKQKRIYLFSDYSIAVIDDYTIIRFNNFSSLNKFFNKMNRHI